MRFQRGTGKTDNFFGECELTYLDCDSKCDSEECLEGLGIGDDEDDGELASVLHEVLTFVLLASDHPIVTLFHPRDSDTLVDE